jgi:hypothetical protein
VILLITYDLKRPGQTYPALYAEIKKAGTWWHHLESTWIIETPGTPRQWYDVLSRHVDANDSLLVVEITSNYWGQVPKEAWDWLASRGFRC